MNAGELAGRHVVVTGASGGLGRAVVDALLEAGADCHLPQLEAELPPPRPRVHVTPAVDLAAESAVERYYATLPPLWASIHLAGGFRYGAITDTTLGDLRAQLDINLVTTFLCCREAVRSMRAQREPAPGTEATRGRIVNVSSRAAVLPSAGLSAYAAAKAAVSAFTQALAAEVLEDGILVNAVAPSIIDTPANRAAMPQADHARWPAPADIARTIRWLVSPENRLTSGAIVPVYGRA